MKAREEAMGRQCTVFSPYLTPDLALNLFMLVALCVYKNTVG